MITRVAGLVELPAAAGVPPGPAGGLNVLSALLLFAISVPSLMITSPAYVFVPPSCSVPVPSLMNAVVLAVLAALKLVVAPLARTELMIAVAEPATVIVAPALSVSVLLVMV